MTDPIDELFNPDGTIREETEKFIENQWKEHTESDSYKKWETFGASYPPSYFIKPKKKKKEEVKDISIYRCPQQHVLDLKEENKQLKLMLEGQTKHLKLLEKELETLRRK